MKKEVKSKHSRNPARTRRNLLGAAMHLFSARGYSGVSVDEIVARAGCNKRMLYHYFGNKDGLYVAVLESVFARLEVIEVSFLRDEKDLNKCLKGLLVQYFEFLEDNPDFVQLLMWENLNQGRFLVRHPELLSKSPVVEELRRILGRKKPWVSVQHLIIQLYAVCFIYHSNRHTFSHTIGIDLHDRAVRQEGMEQAARIILRGLRCNSSSA